MFSIERGGSIKSQGYESKINAFLLYICLNSYKPFGFQVYLLQEVINLFNFEYICRYYSTQENMGGGTKYICGCKEYKAACFFHVHPINSKQQQIFTGYADVFLMTFDSTFIQLLYFILFASMTTNSLNKDTIQSKRRFLLR